MAVACRYFVVPSRVPDSQGLSTLVPVLELPHLRLCVVYPWLPNAGHFRSVVNARPLQRARSVPSRGDGKVDFGSDGDSVVSDGGSGKHVPHTSSGIVVFFQMLS